MTPITPIITIDTMAGFLVSSPALTYQWMFDGDTIIGATNQQYDFNIFGNGVYHVYVTDINGCTSFAMEIFAAESVDELNSSNLIIYPNPTLDLIHISSSNLSIFNVVLRDITGKMIYYAPNINNPRETITMDLSNLERGIYFIHASSNSGKIMMKVVKD